MVVTATDAYTGLPVRAPGSAGSGAASGIIQRKKLRGGQPNPVPRPYGGAGDPTRKPSYIDTDAGKHLPFAGPTGIRDPFATGSFGSEGYNPLPSGSELMQRQIAKTQVDPITGLPITGGFGTNSSPAITPSSFVGSATNTDDEDLSQYAMNSYGQKVDVETGEIKEIVTTDGMEPPAEPTPAGFSGAATSAFEGFSLSGSIDTDALWAWQNTLLGQGLYIVDVQETPPGSGQFTATDSFGQPHYSANMFVSDTTVLDAQIAIQRVDNETARLALDDEMQRKQLSIQEELGRIDQDIARDRIQHEQEIASGNWQNALDVQDRIDERERAGRQLDRDLFNASQELQNRKFELERASFDLDKLEFFQQLSSSPANFADLFNISRGLAPTGAGGPMPQGVSRIGQSNVQQTAAQDFRMNGINMAPNINTGALPTLGAEQAVPQFNPAQAQLSFMNGQDPSPVDATGQPVAPAAASDGLYLPDAMPYAEEGAGIPQDQAGNPAQPNVIGPQSTTDQYGENISARVNAPVNGSRIDGLQTISNPSAGAFAETAEEVLQGAPLPPGIEMAFRNALVGAPQTAQNSIPLLSPQALNQLTPAEREVYFGLAQMQGQYLPDFENLLASRGGSQQVQDSQRVFA
jgi:hypothetical protein